MDSLTGYISFRFPRTRPALDGTPVVILSQGRPLAEVMKLERLTLDELQEAARGQGISDLADVDLAILEPDGKVSFLGTTRDTPRSK